MLPILEVPRAQRFVRFRCWRSHLCCVFLLLLNLLLILQLISQLFSWTSVPDPIALDGPTEVPPHELRRYRLLRKQFGYNAWLAEQLPLRQPVRDVRDMRCDRSQPRDDEDNNQDGASIVVIFRNEQLAMLLRTLHSIKDATPLESIYSILLIDDHSQMGFWKEKLSRDAFDEYVRLTIFSMIRIVHLEESIGVVRARRLAVNMVPAKKVVFLDAHVELTAGWLPPLLLALRENRETLATPLLDELDEQTLEYKEVEPQRGLFDWTLRRREVPLLEKQLQQLPRPYATPLMRAAVFAVNVRVFQHLTQFDGRVNAPAASELELSLQYWCSGGRVLVVPCSRAAHLQPRDTRVLQRYGDVNRMGMQLLRSFKRLAEIWLNIPKYQSKVYEVQGQIEDANIESMEELLDRFQEFKFKSFSWYLRHVATDLLQHFPLKSAPAKDLDLDLGSFRPAQLPKHCLTGDKETNSISILPCSGDITQDWHLSPMGDIRDDDHYCLEVEPRNSGVSLNLCHIMGGYQSWHYDRNSKWLMSNSECLEYDHIASKLRMEQCNGTNPNQEWNFLSTINDDLLSTSDIIPNQHHFTGNESESESSE